MQHTVEGEVNEEVKGDRRQVEEWDRGMTGLISVLWLIAAVLTRTRTQYKIFYYAPGLDKSPGTSRFHIQMITVRFPSPGSHCTF